MALLLCHWPQVYFWTFFACHCVWHLLDAIIVKQTDKMVLGTSNELPITPEVCKHSLRLVGVLKPWIWGWKVRVKVAQSCPTLCDPVDYAVRPEYWSGFLSLLQGSFPTWGSNPGLPHCVQILYQLSHQGSPYLWKFCIIIMNSSLISGSYTFPVRWELGMKVFKWELTTKKEHKTIFPLLVFK